MARDFYWPLLALVIAGGFAAPTATEPEVLHLSRLGEIQACWLTTDALYWHDGPDWLGDAIEL